MGWQYKLMGEEFGPISAQELKDAAANGTVFPDTLVRKSGMDDWVMADKVKGLFAKSGETSVTTKSAHETPPIDSDDAHPVREVGVISESQSTKTPDKSSSQRTLMLIGSGVVVALVLIAAPFLLPDSGKEQADATNVEPKVEIPKVRQEIFRQSMKSLMAKDWADVNAELDLMKAAPLNESEVLLYKIMDKAVRIGQVIEICQGVNARTDQAIASAKLSLKDAERFRNFEAMKVLYATQKEGIETYEKTGHFKTDAAQINNLKSTLNQSRTPDSAKDADREPFMKEKLNGDILSPYLIHGEYADYFQYKGAYINLALNYAFLEDFSGQVFHGATLDEAELTIDATN